MERSIFLKNNFPSRAVAQEYIKFLFYTFKFFHYYDFTIILGFVKWLILNEKNKNKMIYAQIYYFFNKSVRMAIKTLGLALPLVAAIICPIRN